MKITLIGAGMGTAGSLSLEAHASLLRADVVIGSQRLLDGLVPEIRAKRVALTCAAAIAEWIVSHPENDCVCVIYSGDTGFYSGATGLQALLSQKGIPFETLPGISSGQYLCAKLGLPWQDVRMCSAHGRDCDILAEILTFERCLFLTGGDITPKSILQLLCDIGLSDCDVTVGEDLSYPEERIVSGRAEQLRAKSFAPLSVVLVNRTSPAFTWNARTGGIPDDDFVRGAVPMTKREVRSVILSYLAIREDDTIWDIGAGTGSVAVEAALAARRGRVFAIERSPEGCALIRHNRERFGVYHLRVVEGTAPDICDGLPAPDAAFLGGTGGNLHGILTMLLRRNPSVRVVLSAVTLETMYGGLSAMEELGFSQIEATQLGVSRAVKTGAGHLLSANNPVFIVSGVGHG